MPIRYEYNQSISLEQFVSLLKRSTLAARRPVEDADSMLAMLKHANLLCTAWDETRLVGVARSITDFAYCCYLSDLAVDTDYQRQGIGKQLLRLTQSRLGDTAKLILLSAPKATDYYPKIGFDAHPSAWIIGARKDIK